MLQSTREARGLARNSRNRAVPIRDWCGRLDMIERATLDDVPYLTELANSPAPTPGAYPVIGRRETQGRLWRAMRADAPATQRLLIIRGAPGTGLRFTSRLVSEFVTVNRGGLVVTLDMVNAVNETAAGLAERVVGALSAQLPARDPQLTTMQRNNRSVVSSLGEGLQDLANGQATWLVLGGFYEAGNDLPTAVKDLIAGLATVLGDYPVLRLVLIGWLETPGGYEESAENLLPPTALDIASYLTPLGEMPDPKTVEDAQLGLNFVVDLGLTGYPAALHVLRKLAQKYREEHSPGGAG